MYIEQVMTRDVVTVRPETPLKEVAGLLAGLGISGVPVCDTAGQVLGVVSENDILFKELGPDERRGPLTWLFEGKQPSGAKVLARTAGEAMTAPAITIGPKRTVAQAARLMVERGVNRLPVVAADELVGIVSRADLVTAFVRSDDEIAREIRDDVLLHTLWISPERVEVNVEQGDVTLSGELDTRTQAELVEAFAGRVPGVISVTSELSWEFDDLARRVGNSRATRRV
jgi:CBS domain-containing protein